jgi:YaiO family outer membrane protein
MYVQLYNFALNHSTGKRSIVRLCLMSAILISGITISPAQTSNQQDQGASGTKPAATDTVPPAQSAGQQPQIAKPAVMSDKTNWHFEIGGSFTGVNNNYGNWYSGDAKIAYTGSKYFTPMISAGSQTRPEGTQQAYGGGAYINFSKYAYAIVGTGFAPNRGAILYPSFRYDITGVIKVPKVGGLLVTPGYSSYRMGGGHAKIASMGAIYYYKRVILNGGMSYNRSYPGNLPSESGFLSFMTGRQGKYWLGAGASGGNIHYQLIGIIPFDARFSAYGFSAFFQKWIGKNWGIVNRYYFTNVMSAYISNSIGVSLFVDF